MQLPPSHQQTRLIGHSESEAALLSAWDTGRMPHAWLLTGPSGIGKATFAYHTARWALAEDRPKDTVVLPEQHRLYKQIAAAAVPGLLVIEPAEGEKGAPLAISVTQVRGGKDSRTDTRYKGISEFLQLTVADGGWRVVLIDGADQLNEQAQNAVLKILEEPPARTLLLLVCSQPGRLLPTIKSRCRQLRLSALGEPELRELAAIGKLPIPDAVTLAAAHGSIGELIRLTALDAAGLSTAVVAILNGIKRPDWKLDWQAVHELAAQVGRAGADAKFDLTLELIMQHLTKISLKQPALSRDLGQLQQQFQTIRDKYLQPAASIVEAFGFLQKLSLQVAA